MSGTRPNAREARDLFPKRRKTTEALVGSKLKANFFVKLNTQRPACVYGRLLGDIKRKAAPETKRPELGHRLSRALDAPVRYRMRFKRMSQVSRSQSHIDRRRTARETGHQTSPARIPRSLAQAALPAFTHHAAGQFVVITRKTQALITGSL